MRRIDHSRGLPRRCAKKNRQCFAYLSAALIFIGAVAAPPSVTADTNGSGLDPTELVHDMRESVRVLNYEGIFVYLAGGQVETMKIVHVNDGDNTNEYLTSLNGEAREVFRNNSLVTCIWPDSQSIISMKSKNRNKENDFVFPLLSNNNYQYSLSSEDRVADRNTYVIDVKSKDRFRYSYRFWIDKRNKMLLRSSSFDRSNRLVEQMMFTKIRFSSDITISDVTRKLESLDYASKEYNSAVPLSKRSASAIQFKSLPEGYTKVSEMFHPTSAKNDSFHHIFLSDGMTSVSVYVQFENASDSVGLSRLGGVNAYTRDLGSAFTTVIGEVPIDTVRTIAQAVQINPTNHVH